MISQPGVLATFQGLTRVIALSYPVAFFAIFFQTGLPEEIGWRGFAAPNATTLWAFMGHSAP